MSEAPKTRKDYTALRSRLVSQGTTLRGWARRNGHNVYTVYSVARGTRTTGPKARRIADALSTI